MKLIVADTGPVNYLDGVRSIGFTSANASSTLSATPNSSVPENLDLPETQARLHQESAVVQPGPDSFTRS